MEMGGTRFGMVVALLLMGAGMYVRGEPEERKDEHLKSVLFLVHEFHPSLKAIYDPKDGLMHKDISTIAVPGSGLKPPIKPGKFKKLCGHGIWLTYARPNLMAKNLEDVTLYTSTKPGCMLLSELGVVRSLQNINHPSTYFHRDTIVLFGGNNFQGLAWKTGEKSLESVFAHSLATVGKVSWKVRLELKEYCIEPPQDFAGTPVCFLSSFADGSTTPNVPVSATESKCEGVPQDNYIRLQECYDIDKQKVHPIQPASPGPDPGNQEPSETPQPPGAGSVGSGECAADSQNVNLSPEFTDILKARLNGKIFSGMYLQPITTRSNMWKAEMFDLSLLVLRGVCPDSVVSPDYLALFEATYLSQLNKVWESGKFGGASFDEQDWREMIYDLTTCANKLQDHPAMKEVDGVTQSKFESYINFEDDIVTNVKSSLGLRPNNDYVMEVNWFMANIVGASCSAVNGHDANFIPRFFNMFHELFFLPVAEQWTSSANNDAYRQIFAGFAINLQIVKLGLCASNALLMSGILTPYVRPMEQKETILLPPETSAVEPPPVVPTVAPPTSPPSPEETPGPGPDPTVKPPIVETPRPGQETTVKPPIVETPKPGQETTVKPAPGDNEQSVFRYGRLDGLLTRCPRR